MHLLIILEPCVYSLGLHLIVYFVLLIWLYDFFLTFVHYFLVFVQRSRILGNIFPIYCRVLVERADFNALL